MSETTDPKSDAALAQIKLLESERKQILDRRAKGVAREAVIAAQIAALQPLVTPAE